MYEVSRGKRSTFCSPSGLVAILVAAALTLTACSGGPAASSSKQAAGSTLQNVTIAYSAPVFDQMLANVGQKYGVFQKNGINAQVKRINSSEILQALNAGSVQFAVESGPAPEIDTINGHPIIFIAQWLPEAGDVVLMGQPDYKTIQSLQGKAVAATSATAFATIMAEYALDKAHVTAHILPLGNSNDDVSAFHSGSASAAIVPIPQNLAVKSEIPKATTIASFNNLAWPGAGLVATKSYVDAHPSITKDVLRGIAATVTYAKTHRAQMEAFIAQATDSTPQQASVAYDQDVKYFMSPPVPTLTSEESLLTVLATVGISGAKGYSPEKLYDASYMKNALKS